MSPSINSRKIILKLSSARFIRKGPGFPRLIFKSPLRVAAQAKSPLRRDLGYATPHAQAHSGTYRAWYAS